MCDSGSYFDLETVRNYILSRGGKITNHELVKHFRSALTNPATKDTARIQFKEIVNSIATISRGDEGEKRLVLKKKYKVNEGVESPATLRRLADDEEEPPLYKPPPPPGETPDPYNSQSHTGGWSQASTPTTSLPSTPQSIHQVPRRVAAEVYSPGSVTSSPAVSRPASSMRSSASRESLSTPPSSSLRSSVSRESVSTPPPSSLRSSVSRESVSTPSTSHRSSASSTSTPPPSSPAHTRGESVSTPPLSPEPPPPVPPRRKSSDKIRLDYKDTSDTKENKRPKSFAGESIDKTEGVDESKISVRERLQKFNRLATENQLTENPFRSKKRFEKGTDRDEDDSASVSSLQLDPKFREWLVKCSQGDYQPVAKMAAENPRLVKLKNTANGYTALHWAAKYGNQDLVKLIAGTYGANVNARTNGGYTALHIAMQYGHEDLYNLLVKVYGADTSIRDWSGKKARQYLTNKDTSLSADTFRSEYSSDEFSKFLMMKDKQEGYGTVRAKPKYSLSPMLGLARKRMRHTVVVQPFSTLPRK